MERAAELEKFNLSRKYCEQLPLLERAKFESWLDDKQRRATNEILEFIDLAQSTADELDPTDDVEVIRMYLEQARTKLDEQSEVAEIRKLIEGLLKECDRVARDQREAKRREAESIGRQFDRCGRRVVSLSPGPH